MKIFMIDESVIDATMKIMVKYAPVFRCEKIGKIFRISFAENEKIISELEENNILCWGMLF